MGVRAQQGSAASAISVGESLLKQLSDAKAVGRLVIDHPRRDAIQDFVQLLRALSACYRRLTNPLGDRVVLVQKENENRRLVAIAWRMKHTRWNGEDVARLRPNSTKRRCKPAPSGEYGNDLGVIVKVARLK